MSRHRPHLFHHRVMSSWPPATFVYLMSQIQTLNSPSSEFKPPKLVVHSALVLNQSRGLFGAFWNSEEKKTLANTGNPAQKLMKHPRSRCSKVMSVLSREGKDIVKGFSVCVPTSPSV